LNLAEETANQSNQLQNHSKQGNFSTNW